MTDMIQISSDLNSGAWAHPAPGQCPCRGGWMLSDYDTWHRCPVHGTDVPHPDEAESFDHLEGEELAAALDGLQSRVNAAYTANCRRLYKCVGNEAVKAGFSKEKFNKLVKDCLKGEPTAAAWVDAAWEAIDRVNELLMEREETAYWDRQYELHLAEETGRC